MLIPNLPALLAERRLTLSRVSADTGLSRTTLTALTNGSAKGVQFETLNALCQYLNAAPGDLFLYRPFDLTAAATGESGRSQVTFTLRRTGRRDERHVLDCDAQRLRAGDSSSIDSLRVRLAAPADDPDAPAFVELLRALPAAALTDLELQILRAFDARIDPALIPDDYSPELLWPWQ